MKEILPVIFYTFLLSACQPKAIDTQELISEPSYDATLSYQGDLALISTANSGIQLWDLQTLKQMFTWRHGEGDTSAIDTSISENQLYAASLTRNSVGLWRISDGHSLGWWSLPSTGQSVDVANNGSLLIGLNDGSVMSLRPNSRTLIKFLGHSEKVNSVSLSSDGKLALTGANDKHAILWNPTTGQPIHKWQFDNRVMKVLLNTSGTQAFICDSTNNALIMNNNSGKQISKLDIKRRKMNFSAARFSNDDTQLMTGTPAREIILWQVKTGEKLAKWQAQRSKHAQIKGGVVYSVANKGINQIISISSNGLIETWPVPVH